MGRRRKGLGGMIEIPKARSQALHAAAYEEEKIALFSEE